jgi:outer membrane lipoprotein-sorting protein
MHRMKRLLLLACLSFGTCAPHAHADEARAAVLADADAATVRQVQDYLNGLVSLRAHFLQIAQDNATATGTMWLVRPGRIRFQYDPPSPLLLVASHGLAVLRDNKLNDTRQVPVSDTPLGLLLRDKIALSGDVTVTGFSHQAGVIQVTLTKTASPGDGTLTLVLEDHPLALTGWSVVDAQGRETRVQLSGVTLGGSYDNSIFTYVDLDSLSGGNTP